MLMVGGEKMEKERGLKVIAIFALLIGVVGLSIGFANYNATLQISNTSATVGAGSADDFTVEFSTNSDSVNRVKENISSSLVGGASAVIDNVVISETTISGLSANFTNGGQSVTYTLYTHNTGKFLAYLRSITLGNKTCTAIDNTTQSLVDEVCESITMSVKVGNDDATTVSVNNITGHSLAKNSSEAVVLTMTYNESESATDGDFTVNFGQVALNYNYVDGE